MPALGTPDEHEVTAGGLSCGTNLPSHQSRSRRFQESVVMSRACRRTAPGATEPDCGQQCIYGLRLTKMIANTIC